MYTFEDRDGSSLTLRPENTASVIRAYIEHRLDQRPGVQKLYYIGPMFRRERPQKGRYRQFFQIGAEAIGSESPFVDAEVIEMVVEMLTRAGLSGFTLLINSVGDARIAGPRSSRSCAKRCSRWRRAVRRLPAPRRDESAARARLQGARGPAGHRQAAFDSRQSVRGLRAALRRREEYLTRPRHRVRSASRAWCAASTTTCAPRSK